jgi:antitoxin CptB
MGIVALMSSCEKKGSDPISGLAKLRWRCRRGMRELDRILEAFLADGYPALGPAEKQMFAEILEYPDPDLHAYLVGNAEPSDSELARLIRHIRATVSAQAG